MQTAKYQNVVFSQKICDEHSGNFCKISTIGRMSNLSWKHFLIFFFAENFFHEKEKWHLLSNPSYILTILVFEVPADFRVWTAVENPRIAETYQS
jgi:hypothetical protein